MTLKDVPICFAWEDRGIPTAVLCDGKPGMLVKGLQAVLPRHCRPTIGEGVAIFRQVFEMALKMAMINEANGHR